MAYVRVIMMQRDEGEMLSRWLVHYSGLFGIKNLTVLDNGSVDPYTIALLREAEAAGADVMWQFNTPHDFHNKGGHFGNIIRHWDSSFRYDYALPVDCDEILAVFAEDGLSTDYDPIHQELSRLKYLRCALRLDMSLFNVPERSNWFAPVRHFHKGFLPAYSLEILDNGFHEPRSRLQEGFRSTRLTYLHWHNRDYDELLERIRTKLQSVVNVDDREALAEYSKKPGAVGGHMIQMLLSDKASYRTLYDQDVKVYVAPGGASNLLQRPDGISFWSAHEYLEANRDVRPYELTALHHYLRVGFFEKRSLRPS